MQHTDIFQWANNIDSMKRELQVEIFLFNKNYTPYSIRQASELQSQLAPVFMYDVINSINLGAGTGMQVKPLEDYDSYSQMITYTELDKVGRAETLLHLIDTQRNDIVEFSQSEHEFKRMKGMVAVYTHPTDKAVKFYIFKLLQASSSISSGVAWQIVNGELQLMQPDVVVKMPLDNQVIAIGGELFIFNEPKFVKLFSYDLQTILETDSRAKQLEKQYRLNIPEIMLGDLGQYIRDKGSNVKKLLEVNMAKLPDQETLLNVADAMAVELMTDDLGAIILYDNADVGKLLDLINDNYLSSETGAHYLAKSKKSLDPEDE